MVKTRWSLGQLWKPRRAQGGRLCKRILEASQSLVQIPISSPDPPSLVWIPHL